MQRDAMIDRARSGELWDVAIIGGGATGLGIALDAALRGYRTILVEAKDFAHGTSSRSTKLVHGGVRYLARGEVGLVREALRERGVLLRNAPHLVRPLSFVIPAYRPWSRPYYGLGLWLYDRLAGHSTLGGSRPVGRDESLELAPTLQRNGLRGAVVYQDAQFDDARLAVALARAAAGAGAVVLNYVKVIALECQQNSTQMAVAQDAETGSEWRIDARVIVNAAGVWADAVRRLDDPSATPILRPSQGIHLVYPASVLPGKAAVLVPKTEDGRVLFAIPWLGRVLVGTTDTPVARVEDEPRPLEEEIDYLIRHASRHLDADLGRSNILSTFAGLRPLIASNSATTKGLSREHALFVAPSGLVTITGGKWTTYRRMAQDAVDRAAQVAGLPIRPCLTESHSLGMQSEDDAEVRSLVEERPEWGERLAPDFPNVTAEVVRATRHEMARTIEDVLARRMRLLMLDAKAASAVAPRVAAIMAAELRRDRVWETASVAEFRSLADRSRPDSPGRRDVTDESS